MGGGVCGGGGGGEKKKRKKTKQDPNEKHIKPQTRGSSAWDSLSPRTPKRRARLVPGTHCPPETWPSTGAGLLAEEMLS